MNGKVLARRSVQDVSRTAMASPFNRYKREEQQGVRRLEVKGTEIEKLRQAREMLRSMTPEQALDHIEFHKNLTVFEALILAKTKGYLIVPNNVHDRILTERDDQQYFNNYPVWAGTFVIYEAPNKAFGNEVVFNSEDNKVQYTITFNVPKKYQGKKNCALVIEHPDFDLKDLGNNSYEIKVADENDIHLIKNFPKENGWYLTDDKYRIPVRKFFFRKKLLYPNKKARRKNARSLSRSSDAYLGLLVRGIYEYNFHFGGFGLSMFFVQSDRLRVAMIPVAAVTKQSD